MSEAPKPSSLVMLPYREIECDDTLREFTQILRFDLIDAPGEPLRCQLLLDRRHKLNKGLSKPVAYFRMTSTEQLMKLANTALACAVVLAFHEQRVLEPEDEQIRSVLKSYWQLAQPDVLYAVKTILRDVKLHKMALERASNVQV
ncbi:MAG: hypothetical protein QW175_04395 [Candidatus Bathyarchaeia archaeon]